MVNLAPQGSLNTRHTGVGEEVKKTFTARFALNALSNGPVIEKHPCVEVIVQIYPQASTQLFDLMAFTPLRHPLVLSNAALALTALRRTQRGLKR